ncbi:helix-turn-helix transcriptional regulator [Lentilactobacillus parafarraginis]|uniref:HTH cro/C1-type domain-containing protein n=2 Tax=Lentilactobacillus parafarraginis TaxID=390842 RepID=A0A0R1YHE2_9LACO|nr:helix-turn-helix transcriptional regulator [Lentilactobacillus parafarraginis]KRM41815.1 hypothetical protein FD47_GL002212 [Lentilactobacillus parafarraginis DSM 18390 = JCM 14109]TLQ18481.1 helix-turn-helix transcriptional regulator [Lentilactobacillus parafarraginis]
MGDDHFAQQLKAKRMQASLTQQQLAAKMNVSRKTISGWETGRNRPDIDSLKRLAAIYHISLDETDQSSGFGHFRRTDEWIGPHGNFRFAPNYHFRRGQGDDVYRFQSYFKRVGENIG